MIKTHKSFLARLLGRIFKHRHKWTGSEKISLDGQTVYLKTARDYDDAMC